MQSSPLQRFSHTGALVLWFLAVALTSVVLQRGFIPSDYLLVGTALVWLFGFRLSPIRLKAAPICVAVWLLYCFASLAWQPVLDVSSAREALLLDCLMVLWLVMTNSLVRSLPIATLVMSSIALVLAALISLIPSLLTMAKVIEVKNTVYFDIRLNGFMQIPGGPNIFGAFLVVAFLMAMMLYTRVTTRWRWLIFLVLVLLFLGVLLTFSRAAWVSFIVGVGIVGVGSIANLRISWRQVFLLGLCLGIVTIPLLVRPQLANYLVERLGLQQYDESRFGINNEALVQSLQHPLGVGEGQHQVYTEKRIHSFYIRLLFENGWIGFVALMGFVLLTVLELLRKIHRRTPARLVYLFLLAGVAAMLVNGTVVDTVHWRFEWLLFGLAWGQYE